MEVQKFNYDNGIVRAFLYATIVFGLVGFLLGLTAALMLFYPELPEFLFGTDDKTIASLAQGNLQGLIDTQGAFGFGRIRMLHTSAVIFAFVGNAVFAGAYYSMQRLLKTRMYSDVLSWVHFWSWQIMIVAVVITFFMGINTSKEYAEHEWPIDIFNHNFLGDFWYQYVWYDCKKKSKASLCGGLVLYRNLDCGSDASYI